MNEPKRKLSKKHLNKFRKTKAYKEWRKKKKVEHANDVAITNILKNRGVL